MNRIRSAAQLIDDPDSSMTASEMIVSEDERPEKTRLLDQYGRPLFRVRDRIPFGFQGRKR